MPGNRVEELEQTVTRLESTVSGLTEELVEAKERIRDLEAELEPRPADGTAVSEAGTEAGHEAEEADPEAPDPASAGDAAEQLDDRGDGDAAEDERTEFGDDIIVA